MEQLTINQINQVDAFVQSYVKYDDVRVEVVNQLVVEIGAQLRIKPEESFGKALWELGHDKGKRMKSHIAHKKIELRKFWFRKLRGVILNVIFSPKILSIIGIFFFLLYLCSIVPPILILVAFIVVTYSIDLLPLFGISIMSTGLSENEVYRFLASETFSTITSWVFYPFVGVILILYFKIDGFDDKDIKLFIAFCGATGVLFRYIGKSLRSDLEAYYEQYPILKAKRIELNKD